MTHKRRHLGAKEVGGTSGGRPRYIARRAKVLEDLARAAWHEVKRRILKASSVTFRPERVAPYLDALLPRAGGRPCIVLPPELEGEREEVRRRYIETATAAWMKADAAVREHASQEESAALDQDSRWREEARAQLEPLLRDAAEKIAAAEVQETLARYQERLNRAKDRRETSRKLELEAVARQDAATQVERSGEGLFGRSLLGSVEFEIIRECRSSLNSRSRSDAVRRNRIAFERAAVALWCDTARKPSRSPERVAPLTEWEVEAILAALESAALSRRTLRPVERLRPRKDGNGLVAVVAFVTDRERDPKTGTRVPDPRFTTRDPKLHGESLALLAPVRRLKEAVRERDVLRRSKRRIPKQVDCAILDALVAVAESLSQ